MLAPVWVKCPDCWKNYITHLQEKHGLDHFADVPLDVINGELREDYRARYVESHSEVYVKFSNRRYRTIFELRWSN